MSQTIDRNGRVHLIDELRGFLILYVVAYHTLYDLAVLFPTGIGRWFFSPAIDLLRDVFTGALIVISGVACLYSRSNLRRGLKTLGLGMVLTLVTWLVMPDELILFGILHFFGCCMLLYGLLARWIEKIPTLPGVILSPLLFFFTRHVYDGYLGLFGLFRIPLPAALYDKPWLFPVGFACRGMTSADYYPLLPWMFLFFWGAFLGRYIREGRAPDCFWELQAPRLAWLGQHTMIVYLVHQPIVYGILWLVFRYLVK